MTGLVHHLFRRLGALWHTAWGAICFRLGGTTRARRHFERVLDLRGDSFGAYVYLARLAYAQGDYPGWRRELEHARRTNPERFARLDHPFDLFEPRTLGTPFDEAGERATWRAMRGPGPGSRRSPTRRVELATGGDIATSARQGGAQGVGGSRECPDSGVRFFGDDFSSAAERARFRVFPPITGAEIASAAADLDELCRRLSG